MPAFLLVTLTASHIMLAANRVPEFNIEPSCRAAAEPAVAPNSDAAACKRDELRARSELNDQWGQFAPGQRARCVSLFKIGGNPSYVELLTCLEIAKAAKGLSSGDRMTGQGAPD